ncbi:MAG: CGGC domain-containing protein [Spirochaetaceae bacterium]|nr:CGGC domain-containing protein [Spirochaetaceae bacterium]
MVFTKALDTVHIGKCTITNGVECSSITHIANNLESNGIHIIRGTH